MKKWLLYKVFVLSAFLALNGCVIVINQPSAEERELVRIQETVGEQVKYVSQQVESGHYQKNDLDTFITQAQQVIDDGLKKLNELNIPEKARLAAEETKKYLESAQNLFEQMKELISEVDRLKEQGKELSEDAKKVIDEQVQNLQKTMSAFSVQLNQLVQKMEVVRKEILGAEAEVK